MGVGYRYWNLFLGTRIRLGTISLFSQSLDRRRGEPLRCHRRLRTPVVFRLRIVPGWLEGLYGGRDDREGWPHRS